MKQTLALENKELPKELKVAFWFFALSPFFVVPFMPRSFDLDSYVVALAEGFGFASYLMRGATAVAFILTSLLLVKVLVRGRWQMRFLVPMLFLYGGSLGAMLFSLEPRFSAGHLAYVNMLTLVALLVKGEHLDQLVDLFKKITLIYIWASVLASLVVPQWALEIGYDQTYIPGFNIRLHGATVHANHTAPFVWIYILLEMAFPSKSRVLRILHLSTSLFVLILTQSKTTWLLLLFGWGWLTFWRTVSRVPHPIPLIAFLSVILGVSLVALLVADASSETSSVVERLQSLLPEDASTLTGRTFIWLVVMSIVHENPWFGYGPELWSPEMTLQFSGWTGWVPSQSHNQYLQSLGEGGWLGLVFFLAYCLWILALAIRSIRVADGIAFALFGGWLIRGFTEAWFRKATMDGNLLVHAMILALVFALYEKVSSGVKAMGGREESQVTG